ncbi:serine O-acetyltransferase [Alteromonas macleodii]|uniref:serine O-acetyltransferase n=1 Tax=Alteromonas macleodii TaxID=28108 RepID=UPI0001AEBC29|nr:serine acetyltransferase [Alteromonas macleodii]AFS37023.1 serine O-acetyltransferase [Alteromonas macleodii ATCC 27126]
MMIKNRRDYLHFLEQDRLALNVKPTLKNYLTHDIWRFQVALRKLEFRKNTSKTLIGKGYAAYLQLRVRRLGRKLGFSIPANVFGPGLSIAHAGTIVVNGKCKVGANCRVHVCVNIGGSLSKKGAAPHIGDDCYIGPGAKIYGDIKIGDNVAIGANAVVNKSFDSDCTIGGIPAKVIADQGPLEILKNKRTEIKY